jgi:hypothetical protein
MFPDLLSQKRIWNELDQIVDRVDGRMDRLEALNLMSEEKNKFTQKLKKADPIYVSTYLFKYSMMLKKTLWLIGLWLRRLLQQFVP